MNVYKIYNGYTGFSAIHVIVVAPNIETALILAKDAFFNHEQARVHGENYWKNLQAEVLGPADVPWVSEVVD